MKQLLLTLLALSASTGSLLAANKNASATTSASSASATAAAHATHVVDNPMTDADQKSGAAQRATRYTMLFPTDAEKKQAVATAEALTPERVAEIGEELRDIFNDPELTHYVRFHENSMEEYTKKIAPYIEAFFDVITKAPQQADLQQQAAYIALTYATYCSDILGSRVSTTNPGESLLQLYGCLKTFTERFYTAMAATPVELRKLISAAFMARYAEALSYYRDHGNAYELIMAPFRRLVYEEQARTYGLCVTAAMDCFPPEISQLVGSYLPETEQRFPVGFMSPFMQITNKGIDLRYVNDLSGLSQMPQRHTALWIDINNTCQIIDFNVDKLRGWDKVITLLIKGQKNIDVAALVRTFPNLQWLDVDDCHVAPLTAQDCELIAAAPKLTTLSLRNCTVPTPTDALHAAWILRAAWIRNGKSAHSLDTRTKQ